MQYFLKGFILYLLIFGKLNLAAQELYTLRETQQNIDIVQFEVFKDNSKSLSLQEILQDPGFQKNEDAVLRTGLNATYWVRFELRNDSDKDLSRFLAIPTVDFYETSCHLVYADQSIYSIDTIGSLVDLKDHKVISREYSFEIPIKAQSQISVYVYFDRRFMNSETRLYLRSPSYYLNYMEARKQEYGLTTGIAFAYILAALLLFLFFQRRENLYFLIYVVGIAFYIFYQLGFGAYALWGNGPLKFLYDCIPYLATGLSLLGFIGVFRVIFKIKEYYPYLERFFQFITIIG